MVSVIWKGPTQHIQLPRHPKVVGIPDPDWGEAVTAVVIANDGSIAEEIRQFAKVRLAAYKVPKSVHIIKEMPLTQYGKIDKQRLRATMVEEMGADQQ